MSGQRLLWMVSQEGVPGWQAHTPAGVYHIDDHSVVARFIPRGSDAEGSIFLTQQSTVAEAQRECERHWRETSSSNSSHRPSRH